MKNENGTGTTYKLNDKKRRRPWVARVTIGYSIKGKQLRKILGTYETKREAQKALIKYFDNPTLYHNKDKTFGDIKKLWWENYSKKLSKSTMNTKLSYMRALETLENVKLKDISLLLLQNFFDDLNIAYGTKNNIKSILNMIFDYAIKFEFIEINKVHLIDLGINKKVIERKIFTKKEIDTLWENVNSAEKYLNFSYTILILIYTGMRIGELLNLKTEDIDLINNTISIKESKTSAGVRIIPIPDKIIHLFSENINYTNEYFLSNNRGKSIIYETFKYSFDKIMSTLNLSAHTIHDTRHTFATLLNNADANSTSIIKLIGHSDFKTTQNIYTHKDIEELRKAVNLLN